MTYRIQDEFTAHEEPVLAVDLGSDRLVTGGADNLVHVFGTDGSLLATQKEHEDIIKSVRLSSDGRVVSGDRAHAVRVWDPVEPVSAEIGRHDRWVMGVAWSPDGSRVASVSEDATLRVWDAAGGEVARAELRRPGNAVDWSPDGSLIAVAGGDRALHLYTPDAQEVRAFAPAGQMLWGTRFSPDGLHVAWVGRDRVLRVARPSGGDVTEVGRHGQQVWSASWDGSGQRLATASADRTARLWTSKGELLEILETPAWVRFAGWWGPRLVLAGEDGVVRVLEDDGIEAVRPEPAAPAEEFPACPHFDPRVTGTDEDRCRGCGSKEELRLCMTCGHVGCCESQVAHGTKHWEETGHPNTTPVPAREFSWTWCYACDDYVKRVA